MDSKSSPIEGIITQFGGLTAMARALGHKNASTVQGWKQRNSIPGAQIPAVIEAAKGRGIELTPNDFFAIDAPMKGRAA